MTTKASGVTTSSIEELVAKQAITEVIHRYCRGMDRMDKELTLSCWHPGGTDDHAPLYCGSAAGFIEWLWPVHAAMVTTRHVVTNILISLDLAGKRATAESYWSLTLRTRQGNEVADMIMGGRYLDQLECIDGRWAFRHRSAVLDIDRVEAVRGTLADAGLLLHANNPQAQPKTSARDRSDYSYEILGRL